MARYPFLVDITWKTIEKFIIDWQENPFQYDNELSLQSELYSRLNTLYKIIGYNTVRANYSTNLKGFEHNQVWNRITCEPKISYQYINNQRCNCYPDIIIWDDIEDENNPPDMDGSNFPILFACEIKYGEKVKEDQVSWDMEKLKYLIEQGQAKFVCWLNFFSENPKNGEENVKWIKNEQNFWVCNIKVPLKP